MALGKQNDRQGKLYISYDEIPKSPGHIFFDRLQRVLTKNKFDSFVEELCAPYYADSKGRPSIPPGRYFRMHIIGYFEGLGSERAIEWRCSDSLSLREFLLLDSKERVPDHSTLSRIRSRLPLELHRDVFTWVLTRIDEAGLLKGKRIGVDSSTMEANAAMRSIVRKDTGDDYDQHLQRLAEANGIQTPTKEDLTRMDRKRKGKKMSNAEWEAPADPDAKITRTKRGGTRLAYKPEHAVDLDTGAVVAAEVHPADKVDTKTIGKTLQTTKANLTHVGHEPTEDDPAEVVADKGYNSRAVLKELEDSPWKSRIPELKRHGINRWFGDLETRRAVYNNRKRLQSGKGKKSLKDRTEKVERSFQHALDRGGIRRTWLRGRENVQKRYLLHLAGFNLGLLMRKIFGFGTPKGAADVWDIIFAGMGAQNCRIWLVLAIHEDHPDQPLPITIIVAWGG